MAKNEKIKENKQKTFKKQKINKKLSKNTLQTPGYWVL